MALGSGDHYPNLFRSNWPWPCNCYCHNTFQPFKPITLSLILDVKKLHPQAILPTRAHFGDLGFDLYALEYTYLKPGHVTKVRTGIAVNFPTGYGALLRDRSSVATKKEIFVVAGVIDNQYTGEIIVAFNNPISVVQEHEEIKGAIVYGSGHTISAGEKIAQMILITVVDCTVNEIEELSDTERGSDGFGSSGT